MKTKFFIIIGLALLLVGTQADAQQQPLQTTRTRQRQGGFGQGGYGRTGYAAVGAADPRTVTSWPNSPFGTNGFDIIALNNIFNPTRVYIPPRTNQQQIIPSYNFTVNGVMTYGPQDVGYVFFYGNSVDNARGYTNSETINGFKISEIANNAVTLVDTNSKTFTLKVGSGFSKYGTNEWKFLPVPDAASYVPSANSGGDSDNLDAPSGPVSDAMARLMARRRAEMGDTADPAAPDANSAPDTNSIPLTPASTSGDNKP